MGGVAAPSTLSARAGQGVRPRGTTKVEASKSTAREARPSHYSVRRSCLDNGAKPIARHTTSQAVSAPAWLPGLQDNSLLSQPVEQQVGEPLPASKQVQVSNPGSKQESGSCKESQSSSSLTDSWPQRAQLDPGQVQAAPQPPPSLDLQAASNPPLPLGQPGPTAPAFGSEASDSSAPLYATNHPALAEFSSQLRMFAGAEVQAASSPTPSAGETEQTAPVSGSEASDFSTPLYETNHPALAGFSSQLRMYAAAEMRAASSPTPSAGETEQTAPFILGCAAIVTQQRNGF